MYIEGKYLKSIVYGGLDGVITTFAVVAGALGASLSPYVLLILGAASLIGDAFSMGFGDYMSSKAIKEFEEESEHAEEKLLEKDPEQEKQKLKKLYQSKGFNDDDAQTLSSIIIKNKQATIEVLVDGKEISKTVGSPIKKGVYTFCSFIVFGFVPLATYVFPLYFKQFYVHPFAVACFLSGMTLFGLGALKTIFTKKSWIKSGFEMLAVGGLSATAAFIVGYCLAGFVR